jgi:hypothetical protein
VCLLLSTSHFLRHTVTLLRNAGVAHARSHPPPFFSEECQTYIEKRAISGHETAARLRQQVLAETITEVRGGHFTCYDRIALVIRQNEDMVKGDSISDFEVWLDTSNFYNTRLCLEAPSVGMTPISRCWRGLFLSLLERPFLSLLERPFLSLLERPFLSLLERPFLSLLDRPFLSLLDRPFLSLLERPISLVVGEAHFSRC